MRIGNKMKVGVYGLDTHFIKTRNNLGLRVCNHVKNQLESYGLKKRPKHENVVIERIHKDVRCNIAELIKYTI